MQGNTQRVIFALVFVLVFTTRSAAQSFNFTTIDVPCSKEVPTSCPNGIARQTIANGINPAGDIVGVYTDGVGKQHGFLLSGGQFTTIDFPGALAGVVGTLPTSANGINPAGEIVGNYTTPYVPTVSDKVPQDSPTYCPSAGVPACIKGFMYRHGNFSTVLFSGHPGAIPQRITPDGDIYGCLHDFDLMNSMFGAAWRRSGDSSLTTNGGELADPSVSIPMSMNNGATPDDHMIVGHWTDMSLHRHGFVAQDGAFHSYDVSGSTLTAIWDINPAQQFVGTYVDSTGHRHGFLQLPDGSAPIQVDYPGAAATVAFGINPDGVIVGQYSAAGRTHGFVALPVSSN
jgi:hypothetical protein